MVLVDAMLFAPWCTTVHRVVISGLPVKTWETATSATARCGVDVKLIPVRWCDLRTRRTPLKRCRECRR